MVKDVFLKCRCCGRTLCFPAGADTQVCSSCGTLNFPRPDPENPAIAAGDPGYPIPMDCQRCGGRSFHLDEENWYVCDACGLRSNIRLGLPKVRKFKCRQCRWELPIRGKQRIITCPACGTDNIMPQELPFF